MAARAVFSPAVNIYDNDKAITLLADLPGIARPDVDIMLEKRTMTIKAKRNAEPPPGYSLLHEEYEAGDFERSFAVSDEIDATAITAAVRD
ncbi:MAG: Hsp20/alpha crystallin family protein, partial [Oscillospiraceae bacterium]|nr:Hsp20/alpha crystallin family protein [Oscillospiraceae bacterium]